MQSDEVTIHIDGQPLRVAAGTSVIGALMQAGRMCTRRSVSGEARFALCGMGQCQECRVTIDGRAHRLACQERCADAMDILTGERA